MGLLGRNPKSSSDEAQYLRVTVKKNNAMAVDVALPAGSARWLIDLIPGDVMDKIRQEGIPIDDIQTDLAARTILNPQKIFILNEESRAVEVWLE